MIVTEAMADVAAALAGTGLRVHPYAADRINPPAAVVMLPTRIEFDVSANRGTDRIVLPLHIYVVRGVDRTEPGHIGPYLDGSGVKSVKSAVERHAPTAYDVARVVSAEPGLFPNVAGNPYVGAEFEIHIFGEGA